MIEEEMEPAGQGDDADYWESPAGWVDVMPMLLLCVRGGGESARIAEQELTRLAEIVDYLKEKIDA